MGPESLLRELRGGQLLAVRRGLFWLVLGAAVTLMVLFLLAPTMDGLVGLPGHDLQRPEGQVRPAASRPAPVTPLTAAQRITMRRAAIHIASKEVGVREWPGHPNAGARITTYRRAVIGAGESPKRAEPWCADFVSWIWRKAGQPIGFGGYGSDYVPQLVAWARFTRKWHWARDGYKVRPGDLIVYQADGSRLGHIGMVVKVTPGRVHTIEGNYGDKVSRRIMKPWAPGVTGFISPV